MPSRISMFGGRAFETESGVRSSLYGSHHPDWHFDSQDAVVAAYAFIKVSPSCCPCDKILDCVSNALTPNKENILDVVKMTLE